MDFAQSCFYNVEYSFFENVRLYNKPTFYVLYLSIVIDILSQYFEQQWRMVGFTVKKKNLGNVNVLLLRMSLMPFALSIFFLNVR